MGQEVEGLGKPQSAGMAAGVRSWEVTNTKQRANRRWTKLELKVSPRVVGTLVPAAPGLGTLTP